ncbi:MAG: Na+/H+ antiporter [Gemmatimonadales bacterium]
MAAVELVLVLLAAAAALELLARRIGIPHPVLLVIGGLLLSLTPGLPAVRLDPDVVFLVFVPPLLYWVALTSSYRDFKRNLPSISLLALGLVLATACAVAVVAHAIVPGMGWAPAFVLGAIVSPTDAVAATAVARRLGVPQTAITILEGESLVNDATALVAYRMAIGAVAAETFSFDTAGQRFILAAGGGIAIGLIAGLAVAMLRRRIHNTVVENTISLLTPFVAFLPAERVGASGVLAVVTVGLYLGRLGPRIVSPRTRIQASGMWEMVTFLLQGLIFILIGLELPKAIELMRPLSLGHLLMQAALVAGTVIAVRLLWMFPGAYVAARLGRVFGAREDMSNWRGVLFVAWAGMRGGVSLVIALAIPLTVAGGKPFPERDLIIFFTFAVILATLVLQGMSLPAVIHLLKLRRDDGRDIEERKARHKVAAAGLRHLEGLAGNGDDELVGRLRERHRHRVHRYGPHDAGSPEPDHDDERLAADYRRIRGAMIAAERGEMIRLRDQNVISDDVMRQIQHELDLEQMLLDSPRPDPVGEVAERG